MIKNKVLTPVLAGILGVSVVGSGVGYYLVNKDGKNSVKPEETMDTMKVSLTQLENTVTDTVTDVEKAVKGELDYAYDSNLKISLGSGALKSTTTSQNPSASIKPFEINTKVKQKGQNSEAAISAIYNDVTIATLETVYARDSKTAFFRIPELNSSYIKATEEDLKKFFEDSAKKYTDKLEARRGNSSAGIQKKITADTIKPDLKGLTKDLGLPDLSAVDSKKLEEKMKQYAEIVKSKLPAKKENGNASGDIDGNKYDYKVVTYSVNGKQAQDILEAVIDKMAGDTDIEKIYNDFMNKKMAKTASSTRKSYTDFIKELKKNVAVPEKNQNKTAVLDVYYNGEEISGCSFSYDGKNLVKAVLVSKSDVNAVDISLHDEKNKELLAVKGSAKLTDGAMNGTYAIRLADNKSTFTGNLKLDKVVIKDNLFSGTIKLDVNSTKTAGRTQSFSVSVSGKCSKDDKDLTISVDTNNNNIIKIEFKQNKTEATDVEIPTGKFFTLDQLEQYKASCDVEAFKNNITKAIGTDIFGTLNGMSRLGRSATAQKTTTSTIEPSLDEYEYYSF